MVAVGLTGALLLAGPPARAAAEALARRIEQKHRTLKDLTARFVQTYRSGMLGSAIVERGALSLKPPGRMRWEYRDPERKTFVSDGETFYFYVPADRQVIVREQADSRGIPALLLSGRGDILTQFAVTEEPAATAGLRRLRLVPADARPRDRARAPRRRRPGAHPRHHRRGRPGQPQPVHVRPLQGERRPATTRCSGSRSRTGSRWSPDEARRASLLALVMAGCATSSAFRAGEKAERRHDYDQAVLEYSRRSRTTPTTRTTARAWIARACGRRTRTRATGRRLLTRGLHKEALDEFQLALDLNPDSTTLPADIEDAERQPARHRPRRRRCRC